MAWHDELTGDDAIHEIMYVQSSDPGAVGANKFWLDTTGGASVEDGAILKQRNGTDTGWTTRIDLTAFSGTGIAESLIDAKGDLIAGSAADTAARLAVGTNGQVLTADSTQTTGLKWGSAGAGDALTTNPLSQFAATTSAQLAGVISDETGSGVLVFGTAPTLSNPVVGTQSYGDNSTKAASTAFVQAAIYTKVADGNSSTSFTVDWSAGSIHTLTLTGNCTVTFTAPSPALGVLILILTQDGTGSRTVTWPGSVLWAGGTDPTLTTTASGIDAFTFLYDGTNYYGATAGLAYA